VYGLLGCAFGAREGGSVTASGVFVGREAELSSLRVSLQGSARLLLVVGDAGIGKTRFVAEGLRDADAERRLSVWGACLPLAERLPLLPIAEALDALSRQEGGVLLERALARAPEYVRMEAGRLVPRLLPSNAGTAGPMGEWERDRLFSGLVDLLVEVAGQVGLVLVVEDVHWADAATLDFLTFLTRAGRAASVPVVATCRGDEVRVDPQVTAWLAHVRGGGQATEIRLGPLSRAEVAEQVAGLMGRPAAGVADEVFARGEGNPFFTEQLVAAVLAGSADDALGAGSGFPAQLAEMLAARAAGCGDAGRAVLAALAVARRPLTEEQLRGVAELDVARIRIGLRELADARLIGETFIGGYRARHALLAEAIAAGLLAGERMVLHARIAEALEAAGEPALAAEVAGHWAGAGCDAEELRARVNAAEAAERVFGYAEAAKHWQRAIELRHTLSSTSREDAGADLPGWYLRAVDDLLVAGDSEQAGVLADEVYRLYGNHPDPATAAVIHERAGRIRALGVTLLGRPDSSDDGLALIKQALRLFEQAPPSVDQAEAWYYYAMLFGETQPDVFISAAERALDIAETVGATSLTSRTLSLLTLSSFNEGRIQDGFRLVHRAGALATLSGDADAALSVAVFEGSALQSVGRFQDAAAAGMQALETARQAGLQAYYKTSIVAGNAADALLCRGRTAEAGALIDPLTGGPPDSEHRFAHGIRAEIDLLRGDLQAASRRWHSIEALGDAGLMENAREQIQRMTELALWAGCPDEALELVHRGLDLATKAPYLTKFCGRLLSSGMRACADMAERARASGGMSAAAGLAAADELADWVEHTGDEALTNHPFVAATPAERATWNAERTRVVNSSDPDAWSAAATAWQNLGCPHQAGYAWWRQAEAQLYAGQSRGAAEALQAGVEAADENAPLLSQIRRLALRARVPLSARPEATPESQEQAKTLDSHGLTSRELGVLRLLATGRTNAQIGAELFISPKTASVHVTNILRKLGVTTRVQAAAVAERAGLLHD
jgi:DNA-binding CsgD family transcriptional regulator/tetratricopeptide (TPR) repeat protein